eukprot:363127-Chlamydomonas_euryale.AAC.1
MWKQKEGQLARYLSVVGQLAKSQTLRLTLRASSRRAMAERMMDVDLGSENSGEDLGPQCRGGRPRLEERWRKSMAQRMMEDDYGHHHQSTHCPCVDEDAFQRSHPSPHSHASTPTAPPRAHNHGPPLAPPLTSVSHGHWLRPDGRAAKRCDCAMRAGAAPASSSVAHGHVDVVRRDPTDDAVPGRLPAPAAALGGLNGAGVSAVVAHGRPRPAAPAAVARPPPLRTTAHQPPQRSPRGSRAARGATQSGRPARCQDAAAAARAAGPLGAVRATRRVVRRAAGAVAAAPAHRTAARPGRRTAACTARRQRPAAAAAPAAVAATHAPAGSASAAAELRRRWGRRRTSVRTARSGVALARGADAAVLAGRIATVAAATRTARTRAPAARQTARRRVATSGGAPAAGNGRWPRPRSKKTTANRRQVEATSW